MLNITERLFVAVRLLAAAGWDDTTRANATTPAIASMHRRMPLAGRELVTVDQFFAACFRLRR